MKNEIRYHICYHMTLLRSQGSETKNLLMILEDDSQHVILGHVLNDLLKYGTAAHQLIVRNPQRHVIFDSHQPCVINNGLGESIKVNEHADTHI